MNTNIIHIFFLCSVTFILLDRRACYLSIDYFSTFNVKTELI